MTSFAACSRPYDERGRHEGTILAPERLRFADEIADHLRVAHTRHSLTEEMQWHVSIGDVAARLIADASGLRLERAARVESISITDPPQFR